MKISKIDFLSGGYETPIGEMISSNSSKKEEGIRNLYEIDKANSARGRLLHAWRV